MSEILRSILRDALTLLCLSSPISDGFDQRGSLSVRPDWICRATDAHHLITKSIVKREPTTVLDPAGTYSHLVPQREISVIGSRVFLSTAFLNPISNTNNLYLQCNSPRLAPNADSKRRLVVLAQQEDIHVTDVKNRGECSICMVSTRLTSESSVFW
jgi:hypothetical protein